MKSRNSFSHPTSVIVVLSTILITLLVCIGSINATQLITTSPTRASKKDFANQVDFEWIIPKENPAPNDREIRITIRNQQIPTTRFEVKFLDKVGVLTPGTATTQCILTIDSVIASFTTTINHDQATGLYNLVMETGTVDTEDDIVLKCPNLIIKVAETKQYHSASFIATLKTPNDTINNTVNTYLPLVQDSWDAKDKSTFAFVRPLLSTQIDPLSQQPIQNKRNFGFILIGNMLTQGNSIVFSTPLADQLITTDLTPAEYDAKIKCAVIGKDYLPVKYNTHTFSLDFTNSPINLNERIEIKCEGMYLDFTNYQGQVINFVAKSTNPEVESVNMPMIAEDFLHPFKFTIPSRTVYEPFITFSIEDIPQSNGKTIGDKWDIKMTWKGLVPRHTGSIVDDKLTSLHYITLKSYLPGSNEPTLSGFSIDAVDQTNPTTVSITFPKGHERLSAHIRIATEKVEPTLSVDVIMITKDYSVPWRYRPDERAITSWVYNPGPTTTPLTMKFGNYVQIGNEKKKSLLSVQGGENRITNTTAPSFQLNFPGTTTSFENIQFSLSTNSSLVGIEKSSAFYLDSLKKDSHLCSLVEFKSHKGEIKVELDFNQQVAKFNFTGVEELKETNKSFTLSCPELLLLPVIHTVNVVKNDHSVTKNNSTTTKEEMLPIALVFQGLDQPHIEFSTSLVVTPPMYKANNGNNKMVIKVVIGIAVVTLVLIIGFFAWKTKFGKKSNNKQDVLLGNDDYQNLD